MGTMKNNKVIRVGLYERVSTDEQALHGYSIETQIDALDEFCKKKGYKIVDHYTDAGVSGGKAASKRPEMSRLLEDVEAGKIDMILFTKLDRWFRNIQEYFKVQEVLEKNRVEWKAIMEDYDTTTASGRMSINIYLSVAQNERERASERTRFEHKRRNKEVCFGGANPPFGYLKQKDENGIMRLVIDPETEPIVREYWRMLIEGSSMTAAGRILNMTFGLKRDIREWRALFYNEFYRGMYKGVKDFCPKYIDEEEWNNITGVRRIKKAANNRCYLFAGLIKCPECGYMFASNYSKRQNGKEYFGYRCNRVIIGICTNNKSVTEMSVERWLIQNVKDRLEKFLSNADVEEISEPKKPKCDKVKIVEKIRRLNVIYMAGGKTDDEYTSEMQDLNRLLAEAERKESDNKPRDLAPLREFLESDFETVYASLEQTEKRQLWRSIIDTIEVEGNRVVGVNFKA